MHLTIDGMAADTSGEVQAIMPPGLERSAWKMTDPPEIVAIWFGPEA
jgi:hypothetical protein